MITNPFVLLKQLIPDAPLLVATVVDVGTYGVTVEFPDGAMMRVRGVGTTGQRVFVRAGAVEGPAPTLPFIEIDV